jgi:CheY-like chemotaxis protein
MIRLLCVEGDACSRAQIATSLGAHPDIRVVAAAASAGEALACLRREAVDVVVVDPELPGADGFQLLNAILHSGRVAGDSPPPVLFCAASAGDTLPIEARAMGACGVVDLEQADADLAPAIRAVAGGGLWFPSEGPQSSKTPEPLRGRVLVAEDNRGTQAVLHELLRLFGCSTEFAATGHDALRELERQSYDLVLLDHHLPGALLGTEVLEEIARRWPRLPVLFVTAQPEAVEAYRAHPSVRGILGKPFRIRDLQEAVTPLLQRHGP